MHVWRKCFKLEIPQNFLPVPYFFRSSLHLLQGVFAVFAVFEPLIVTIKISRSFSFIFSRSILILISHLNDKVCLLTTFLKIYIVFFESHETQVPGLLSL